MQRKPIAMALAFAGTIGLAAAIPSFAADTGGNTNSKTGANAAAQSGTSGQTGTSGTSGMSGSTSGSSGTSGSTGMSGSSGTMSKGAASGKGQSFDKTGADAQGWNTWSDSQAKSNNGRVSRKAYMDEVGRRWDSMDNGKQGLTPAEVSRLYGNVDSAAMPAKTGSGVQGGNMGPGNQKGQ